MSVMSASERRLSEYKHGALVSTTKGYLVSRSTRDARLNNRRPQGIRVAAPVGITGGYVLGAKGDDSYRGKNTNHRSDRRTADYFAAKNR